MNNSTKLIRYISKISLLEKPCKLWDSISSLKTETNIKTKGLVFVTSFCEAEKHFQNVDVLLKLSKDMKLYSNNKSAAPTTLIFEHNRSTIWWHRVVLQIFGVLFQVYPLFTDTTNWPNCYTIGTISKLSTGNICSFRLNIVWSKTANL